MKRRLPIFAVLLVVLFAACKKDDVIDDPGTTNPVTGISFTCKDTIGIPDIFVGIAPQAADRDSGIFLKTGLTDNIGKIQFTGLDPQTFYYTASRTVVGGIVKRYGSVIVEKDVKKFVTVNF